MAKFKTYRTNQSLNIKLDINNIIDSGHLCKKIEHIVSKLDTSKIEESYSFIGQNALHPKMMLSTIFYAYAVGIRSGRKLATACQENLPFIYLTKGYYPQKTSFNDFREKNYMHFQDLFAQVFQIAEQQGIGDFSLSIADGTKIEANSSKKRSKNKEQFEKWQASLLKDISEIEEELLEEQGRLDGEILKKN